MSKALQTQSDIERKIAEVKTPPEANLLRNKIRAVQALAPKRTESFETAFNGGRSYCEVSARAGELWSEVENKLSIGRPTKNRKDFYDFRDAGFSNKMDATICTRLSELTPEERKAYYYECEDEKKLPTLGGLYIFWRNKEIERQSSAIARGEVELPKGVFDVIVIDPPWPYGTQYNPEGRRAASFYPEMSLDEIADISLPTSDDCILWLWTTHAFMRHSFEILDRWEFKEKAIVTWVKNKMGLGQWLRSQSEFCIMAVKGSPAINLTNQTTVIYGPMREHSRKPDEFYTMVDSLCVGRKLDWFSREKREGWEQVGNTPEMFDELAKYISC